VNAAPERRTALIVRAGLCLGVIICGLALRRFGLGFGLPSSIVKYGGSVLWGTMVYFWVAIVARHWPRRPIAALSAAIAIGVELFRLVHTPGLDAFRLTPAGALLLGRIFSPWDMLAYGVGIGLGVWIDGLAVPLLRLDAGPG
jgi:Protein of unknown function (DUF2809)